ncbi:hypothetical protein [Nocardioides taihuensis]|uniref:Peptidase C39 domain-containing protein n=1 Tax=Nocardioides taihuensis TaxID=1835606 RepID=A0ABW0BFK5_9ACTN
MADLPVFAQPDRRTCGPSSLVVARALHEPSYAVRVGAAAGFRAEVLALHRRVTGWTDRTGRLQLPWPRALGTAPWAAARDLAATVGTPYRTGRVTADTLTAATPEAPVALYVGNRWSPRHVVLVTECREGTLRVYEPSSGRWVDLPLAALLGRRFRLAGWDRPWFSVAPRARRTPA